MKFISVENVPTQPKIILTDKDEKKQIASIMKLLKKKGIEFFKYFMVPRIRFELAILPFNFPRNYLGISLYLEFAQNGEWVGWGFC